MNGMNKMAAEKKTEKLWAKSKTSLNPAVSAYMASKNMEADNALVPYDIRGSIAHAQMLAKVGLLEKKEAAAITDKLEKLQKLYDKGHFNIAQGDEDMHTAIESYLVAELGDVGKKVHVGRSRNDQVLTAMRLYSKEALVETKALLKATAETILKFASKHEFVPMPGFTHMQHAMPSSVGQWAGAFVEALINDIYFIDAAIKLNNQCPLGSAAGFGTAMPLDRKMTAKALGFERVQVNTIYCQNSRGKIEAATISALMQVMMSLGKLANDMVIFTCQEFDFFAVDNSLTTGSSIMPQKQNLDIMEVLRANVSVMQSLQIQCQSVTFNLISGYNKDLKITKKPLLDAFEIAQESLKIVALLFENIEPKIENLEKPFEDTEIYAADYANELVQGGMTFRDAYKEVGDNLDSLQGRDVYQNIKSKTHIGATGNLGLADYKAQLKKL